MVTILELAGITTAHIMHLVAVRTIALGVGSELAIKNPEPRPEPKWVLHKSNHLLPEKTSWSLRRKAVIAVRSSGFDCLQQLLLCGTPS
jgi:hypothetical protein